MNPARINDIVHGRSSITASIALRLGKYFGTTPELWMNLQADYDLRRARATDWPKAEPRVRVLAAEQPRSVLSDASMKLGFEESPIPYTSGSQSARVWTERWVRDQVYCPNCGGANVSAFPNNSPVADFFCASCNEEYELKSQKTKFGDKVLDGAFGTKCERLAADNNPSLFLLNYDLAQLQVRNFFVVPKHFFVRDIIEERKPLAPIARRAGWIGSHIRLDRVPESGKIFLVRNGVPEPKEDVLAKWQRTLFLRDQEVEARGWLVEVMKCVESLGRREFTIEDAYAFEEQLSRLYPDNRNVKPKIRQQLQFLRDRGYLDFVSRGYYRLRASD